jgi:hypothetical protein
VIAVTKELLVQLPSSVRVFLSYSLPHFVSPLGWTLGLSPSAFDLWRQSLSFFLPLSFPSFLLLRGVRFTFPELVPAALLAVVFMVVVYERTSEVCAGFLQAPVYYVECDVCL